MKLAGKVPKGMVPGSPEHWVHSIMRSAAVSRYHTETTTRIQTVGEHTYGVFWLAYYLADGELSMNLATAIMGHDLPEHVTGDIPAPTKLTLPLDARLLLEQMEEEVYKELGLVLPPLNMEQQLVLKMADYLDGCAFCLTELARGNRTIKPCLDNFLYAAERLAEKWESRSTCYGRALKLLDIFDRTYRRLES